VRYREVRKGFRDWDDVGRTPGITSADVEAISHVGLARPTQDPRLDRNGSPTDWPGSGRSGGKSGRLWPGQRAHEGDGRRSKMTLLIIIWLTVPSSSPFVV
jgi:hypothetical protein